MLLHQSFPWRMHIEAACEATCVPASDPLQSSACCRPRSAHEPVFKIAGFGMSKSAIEESMPKTRVPSAAVYTPPELLAGGYGGPGPYDGAACDAWACGVCLFCAPRRLTVTDFRASLS